MKESTKGGKADDKDAPWYGKRCIKCDSPINYAYKSQVEGLCGRCTDKIRAAFRKDWEIELKQRSKDVQFVVDRRGGGGRFFLGALIGVILGFGGAGAIAFFLPDTWRQLIGLLGGGG